MKAAFYTLGCKVNQVETQAMERLWEERGHTVVEFTEAADAYVVNTCSVTAVSDQKSRQMVRRVRRAHPKAVVAVCGCFSQTHQSEAAGLGADLVGGSGDRAAFVALLEQAAADRLSGRAAADMDAMPENGSASADAALERGNACTDAALERENDSEDTAHERENASADAALEREDASADATIEREDASEDTAHEKECSFTETAPETPIPFTAAASPVLSPALSRRVFEPLPAGRLRGRTRAMLKVEDGCANFCAYCIIPYARGPVRSAPLDTAVRQAEELRGEGVREIVLTGIEISSWGRDLKTGQSLLDLTEAVCRAVPDTRVRLGSLEPRTITEDFCRRAAVFPNLCPQFHLSLQSGCDDTLRRMRRKYDTARYALSADLLRRFFHRPAITTDLIVGFPGETEADFSQTLAFLNRVGFARVHVFPYSPRPGTPAADMEQVAAAVKEERARRAAAAAAWTRAAYLADCVGETYPVLFERPRDGRLFGRAPNYMEVYADVPIDVPNSMEDYAGVPMGGTAEAFQNQILPVRILSSGSDALYGKIAACPI